VPAPARPATPGIFDYSDTSLSRAFNFTTRDPNVEWSATKNVSTLNHIDAWKYGTNYLNVDLLASDSRDPEAPWGGPLRRLHRGNPRSSPQIPGNGIFAQQDRQPFSRNSAALSTVAKATQTA
jgi:hypothetical protein